MVKGNTLRSGSNSHDGMRENPPEDVCPEGLPQTITIINSDMMTSKQGFGIEQSAHQVQETLGTIGKSVYELMNDIMFFKMLETNLVFSERSKRDDLVEVKVMATLVSSRNDMVESREPELDIHDGLCCASHFVGMVQNIPDPCDRTDPMKKGDLVTSIRKCGVKARLVTVPKHELIPVPGSVDPGEAVSVISTALPAFEALHHGDRRAQLTRYSPFSLRNKKVLITGGGSLKAQAAVKMAVWGGASIVFVLNSGKVLSSQASHGDNVTILGENPKEWLPVVKGGMDLVVDFEYPKNIGAVCASLGTLGRLVCVHPDQAQQRNESFFASCERLIGQSSLIAVPRASVFEFEEHVNCNFEDVKNDLAFLFELLGKRQIRPSIEKYVKSGNVLMVQEEMRTRAMAGAVVCEPWSVKE